MATEFPEQASGPLQFPQGTADGDTFVYGPTKVKYTYTLGTNHWRGEMSYAEAGVTSVDVAGSEGIEDSGGPITSAGTIDVTLNVDGLPDITTAPTPPGP